MKPDFILYQKKNLTAMPPNQYPVENLKFCCLFAQTASTFKVTSEDIGSGPLATQMGKSTKELDLGQLLRFFLFERNGHTSVPISLI